GPRHRPGALDRQEARPSCAEEPGQEVLSRLGANRRDETDTIDSRWRDPMTDIDGAILRVTQRRVARGALAGGGPQPLILQNCVAVVRLLPKLLQRHGLGQALACLQLRGEGRPNSAYTLLARQLDRWLLTNLGVSDRTALTALSTRDSRFYLEASELAWLFARAVFESPGEVR